jgi:hypothetical protein
VQHRGKLLSAILNITRSQKANSEIRRCDIVQCMFFVLCSMLMQAHHVGRCNAKRRKISRLTKSKSIRFSRAYRLGRTSLGPTAWVALKSRLLTAFRIADRRRPCPFCRKVGVGIRVGRGEDFDIRTLWNMPRIYAAPQAFLTFV